MAHKVRRKEKICYLPGLSSWQRVLFISTLINVVIFVLTVIQSYRHNCFIVIILLLASELELQMVLLDTVSLCGNTGHDFLNDQPQGKLL